MVEATLEDPKQVLRAQERKARDAAMIRMKMDGLDYDERMERFSRVTYPKPLEDMLQAAFDEYRHDVPWANDYWLSPKSVMRDMVETRVRFHRLHRALRHRPLRRHAAALPVRRIPRVGAYRSAGKARRAA